MNNVIELFPSKAGDLAFLTCDCKPEPTPFIVVALVGKPAIITALVCPECQKQVDVIDGRV